MAEIVSVVIDAIVTGEAVVAECEKMGLGEGNIHLAVAGLAGVCGESRDVALMAVITGERIARSCALMSI